MSCNTVKKLIGAALAVLLIFCGAVMAQAEDIDVLVESAVRHQLDNSQVETVQQWIDTELADSAGLGAEWYIIALSKLGSYDFSNYSAALAEYIQNTSSMNASSRQRCAVALQCAGYYGDYIVSTPEKTVGKQGIMSLIFGLHVLNNMADSEMTEQTLDKLLELQLDDGGWALYGEVADIDVTAMTVQALSEHIDESEYVSSAVNEAVELLAEKQNDNGSYSSFGRENAESCAQVIIALSSLGIDCRIDERFIKNESSVLDALLSFRLENGGFVHEHGGEENSTANVQALCALVSLKAGNIYTAENQKKEILITEPDENVPDDNSSAEKMHGYKFWVVSGIVCVCVIVCAVMLIKDIHIRRKKVGKTLKNCIAIIAVGAILAAVVMLTDIKSADEFYSGVEVSDSVGKAALTISCGSVAGRDGLPDDGMILAEQNFDIVDGDTVYDLLVRAAKEYRIQMDTSGTGELIYVSGIANLYEFDYGDLSGWVYTVNGEMPQVGCGAYRLSAGDTVEWIYTTDMGRDID